MKKKKLLSLVVAGLLSISVLAGCGSTEPTESGDSAPAATDDGAASDDAASDDSTSGGGDYTVAMISDTSVSDGGWGSSCYQAMLDAAKEAGWETVFSDGVAASDYATAITEYCEQGCQLIFAPGNQYSDAVDQVSEDFPDTYFCLLNGTIEKDNVTSVLPNATQIGYMAGALAGLLDKTGNVGFIGGVELDTTKEKLECYTAAAKKVNPDIQVQSAYAGSFDDSAKGKEIASSMVSTYDVDVFFGDASAVDSGAREAIKGQEGRFGVGQPGDLGGADDEVIANSVVTDNAALVLACIKDVEAGTYGNKTIEGDLENGCLSIGTFSTKLVPQDIQTQYEEIVEQIKAGEFIK
ncbi:BMP family protein [Lachnospiraceae bacterium ZAX-1]